ncbi:ESCRT-II complex subunit-domain-containing protein [Lipomyces chichibuensis]|uniref:ESCRT-II complex subunit-domain-containing protein n=1 Tax=Lipomyces chichibuensis TaxID=1546026 RepID=UPI0033439DC5
MSTLTSPISTSSRSTSFPFPSIYSFPPFFTRQPNSQTWTSQLSLWNSLILAYCRYNRIWRIDLNTAIEWDLFNNRDISRSLKLETCKEVLDSMVKKGDAEWVSGSGSQVSKNTSAIIYWRRPEEWANIIADWIDSTGQKNTILTLYEIAEGDLSLSQDFRGIDPTILRKALDVLIRRGQAQIMKSADGEEAGVKFFGSQ